MGSAQLAVENYAKAVIAYFRVPSWSHDPSGELLSLLGSIPADAQREAAELADIAKTLAPEHGRATYGEPERGLLPWEVYTRSDAERALELARAASRLTALILSKLGIDP
ncbi:HEPN domain-containing protein [Thermofilum pendens]|uniref:HEPN domain-containing protein n=1 Tax=Thermofilum pendens (strain DSM 2475 / Hrk 5) TaxID=368408 RepID=A1S051_THEPD|nr:hypothetical protein Tpen_1434 [Thermofilum pendens Hrk 5]